MSEQNQESLKRFLDVIGLNEHPVGIFFTDVEPVEGTAPKPLPLPTREKEEKNLALLFFKFDSRLVYVRVHGSFHLDYAGDNRLNMS